MDIKPKNTVRNWAFLGKALLNLWIRSLLENGIFESGSWIGNEKLVRTVEQNPLEKTD